MIRLTNGQRGDLIDALEMASDYAQQLINSNLPPSRRNWTETDHDDFAEWTGQVKRYRKLRDRYLAEEKIALKNFPKNIGRHFSRVPIRHRIEVLPKADHTRLHHPRQRIPILCGQCGNPLEVHPYKLRYSKSGKVFCNKRCSGLFNSGRGIRGNPFTQDEVDRILSLRKQGKNYNQIAVAVSRNRESIRTLLLRKESPCVL